MTLIIKSQYILIANITPIHAYVILDNPSGSPRLTNLEFRSNLERFLMADGDRNVVVIGHVNCYGIRRARELSIQPHNSDGSQLNFECHDSDGGQICYIDDWLEPLAQLLRENPPTINSDRGVSEFNIRTQVGTLKKTITDRKGGWGTRGTVTIVGLFFDDTIPGLQTTQLIVEQVPRRE